MVIDIEERRMSGMRYHTAKPIFEWRDPGGLTSNTWHNMVTWCVDTYGPTPEDGVWAPGARWYANNAKFWFREHKDLEWFMLRWS